MAQLHHIQLYDAVHILPPPSWCPAWPLSLDLPAYREAVEAATEDRLLTGHEGKALIAAAEQIFGSTGDGKDAFRSAFANLAAATTPTRACAIARWTPFSPSALRRAVSAAAKGARR